MEVAGMVDAKTDGRDATLDAIQAIVRRLSIVVESKILANQKPRVSLPTAPKPKCLENRRQPQSQKRCLKKVREIPGFVKLLL
jgi:hypothetical protein